MAHSKPSTAIVLAGGAGTRLQSVVSDVPKPMAPVCGKPFLHFLLLFLEKQHIKRVILSVGFKADVIKNYFGSRYQNIEIIYCEELTPLGTGGAIRQSLMMSDEDCFVLNGDTMFEVDLQALNNTHHASGADITLALSHQKNFDRYGTVEFDETQRITAFREKQFCASGWINGGVYVVNKNLFEKVSGFAGESLLQKFSFEKTVLEEGVQHLHLQACLHENYFIDIGIPEDYAKAQNDFSGK